MDWSTWESERRRDLDVLWRIVVLLLVLASLADSAARSGGARRRQLLTVLGHGEAAARKMVVGMATGEAAVDDLSDAPERPGSQPASPGGAAILAASLRVLAFVLAFLLTQAQWGVSLDQPPCRHAGRKHTRRVASHRLSALTTPDTS